MRSLKVGCRPAQGFSGFNPPGGKPGENVVTEKVSIEIRVTIRGVIDDFCVFFRGPFLQGCFRDVEKRTNYLQTAQGLFSAH